MVWFPGVRRWYMSLRKMALPARLASHHRHMPYTAHQVHQHTRPLTWWQFGMLCLAPFLVGALGLILSRLA